MHFTSISFGSLVIIAGIVSSIFALPSNNLAIRIQHTSNETYNDSFDFFMLSVQWPGTVCKRLTPCFTDHAQNQFTIHGLWPSNNEGEDPHDCYTKAKPFDPTQIHTLLPELRKYWTDYKQEEPVFWSHEWNKHGTCASIVSTLHTELLYFDKTVHLLESLSIASKLAKHGIIPDVLKQYNTDDIKEALKKELGGYPMITCYDEYIGELRLCLNKNLIPYDCPEETRNDSNDECGATVIIPPVKN
jgi:ribonuclease T2